jgi:hypothetical protein
LIFAATHIPVPDWARGMGVSDKTMHFTAYAMLGFLMWFCMGYGNKADWRKLLPWVVFAVAACYGIADELLQKFISGRSADMQDFAADLIGIATAMLTVSVLPGRLAVVVPIMLCPVFVPGLVRAGLLAGGTIFEFGGYFICFAAITFLLAMFLKNRIAVLLFAAADLVLLKVYAIITNKPMGAEAMLSAFAALMIVIGVLFYFGRVKRIADKN